ncbi:hypothetical protein [Cohnella rhizosphaerae]|uniref:Uncharacterized protein n=1 Tax=Cohnella rhizosphaerae TaxID=1457232 RepID=A0A9X4QX94_9BACL|nr:hypothetical protein [Cohnella rhizosphaerae]MDG0814363.1 hypothetical protein [Cohnella rhizosphaerae]
MSDTMKDSLRAPSFCFRLLWSIVASSDVTAATAVSRYGHTEEASSSADDNKNPVMALSFRLDAVISRTPSGLYA